MDHVVYLDAKAKELENILSGKKTIVIRGATGRKMPYGRVVNGDILYFIENKGDGLVTAKAEVKNVFESEKQTPADSKKILTENQHKTCLNDSLIKRFSKRYLMMFTLKNIERIDPFKIDRSNYGNMDDWLLVEEIESIK
jgi:hypothetical protein